MADQTPPDTPAKVQRRGEKARRRARKSRAAAPRKDQRVDVTGGKPEGTVVPAEQSNSGAAAPPTSRRGARRKRGAKARERGVAAKSAQAKSAQAKSGAKAPAKTPDASAPRPAPYFHGPFGQSYAAIDLGTNNCRLLIARPAGDSFVVVDAFSRVVRLGEGLAQTGRLSDAAMERAMGALRICADKLRRRGVALARSVATEACRRATNGPEFIERVRRETGIALDIISAREEARLAVLGCHILIEPGPGPALVFDIGGGSTELVLIEHQDDGGVPLIRDFVSIPYGVVSLTESCRAELDSPQDRAERYAEMRALVDDGFAAFAARIAPLREGLVHDHGPLRLLGTSGTVTTLASVHLDLPHYDRSAVDGCIVPAASMRAISQRLSSLSVAGRREVACIGRERADLVVAGCAILESILDLWPAARLGVADRGIREGILRSLIGITHSKGGAA
ncbi:Ppx/GppA phosphatase family protein [Novosphingobium sp. 1748]|uniref:Ppx/GppA phosphatase family protein n=1 Tax=Novosphingobium sp. 1748 TaxID=2817760 RepID=UPI00086965FF|nr:Ppx/GppA family phosphatase [Novosphingobium sp.]ODU79906.1 MAG: exopolyphosphatase [Novosphingobium sp. SCN 63-17]OJX88998.1 MAG: exopolyphosphatase [Novosphingobium sp. 63-713]